METFNILESTQFLNLLGICEFLVSNTLLVKISVFHQPSNHTFHIAWYCLQLNNLRKCLLYVELFSINSSHLTMFEV